MKDIKDIKFGNGIYIRSETVDTIKDIGTIIDFETIGDIDNDNDNEEERYINVKPFIFGVLSLESGKIIQWYVENEDYISNMSDKNRNFISNILSVLSEPFYAFSSQFERNIIKNITGKDYKFLELQTPFELIGYREKKQFLCNKLMIDNYNDPFDGDGGLCITEFESGNVENSLKHNRACLLKEYDILISRGVYKID